jgi:Flp pilus assembly protein TadD
MKTKILSAALAALAFAGCNEPQKKIEAPSRPVAVVPVPQLVMIRDAGQLTQAAPEQKKDPVDTLALAHDQPKVDHLERAKQLKGDGDFAGALTEARRALYNDDENDDALSFIARVAPRTGRHDLSAEAFGRIADLHPDDAMPVISQTRELISAKQFKEATFAGREAVLRDPQNVEGWQALGRAHLSAGDLPSAIVAFEKAIEIAPTHGYALNNLGLAYLRANENPSAAQVLERAVAVLPNVAYVQNNLGVAYERMGQVDEAKAAYDRATALSPRYVKARINSERVAKVKITPDMIDEDVTPDDANAVPEPTTP